MAFDLTKAGFGMKSMSKLDTIVEIPLDHIHENEKNFYGLRDIDALAESIRTSGLLDPIAVTQQGPQSYRIISGHRRYHAYGFLAAHDEKFKVIPARVVDAMDDPSEVLALIGANATTRELTYAEKLRQEKSCREALEAMKAAGKEIPKRLGDYIAEQLGTSRNEVSRMHSVNEHLIPEAMEKVEAGEMNASEAYQMSRKAPEEQQRMVRKPVEGPGPSEKQLEVNQQIEDNRNTYLEKYKDEMMLLDNALRVILPEIIPDSSCWGTTDNRQEAIDLIKKIWRNQYISNISGYSIGGCKDGVNITHRASGKTAIIRWTDLYDHMSLDALRRVQDDDIEYDTPAPEPKIIRETVLSEDWQTGYPTAEGEYVCVFNCGTKVQKRICEWRKNGEGYAWCFLNGAVISAPCTKWIKLPEE